MKTYLLTYPGWDAGNTVAGKLWLKSGAVIACESLQDYAIRKTAEAANGNLQRCCCGTWKGLQETLQAMPVQRREYVQDAVEPVTIDEEDWVSEAKPRPKAQQPEEVVEVEINPKDMSEPWGRTAKCRGCKKGPCTLTKREVAALPYMDAERFLESPVCFACQKRKREQEAEKRNGNGKLKGRAAKLQALLEALQECERTGYQMTEQELLQLTAAMAELGVTV